MWNHALLKSQMTQHWAITKEEGLSPPWDLQCLFWCSCIELHSPMWNGQGCGLGIVDGTAKLISRHKHDHHRCRTRVRDAVLTLPGRAPCALPWSFLGCGAASAEPSCCCTAFLGSRDMPGIALILPFMASGRAKHFLSQNLTRDTDLLVHSLTSWANTNAEKLQA